MPKSRKRQRQLHRKKMVGGKFRFNAIFGPNVKGIEQDFKNTTDQRTAFVQTLKKKYNELEKANANVSIDVMVLNAKKKNKEEEELLKKQLKGISEKLKTEIDAIHIEAEKRELELKQLTADIKANSSFWSN